MRHRLSTTAVMAFTVLVGLSASRANASIITFLDRATFLTTTGASDATGALPDLGIRDSGVIPGSSTTTVGSVTVFAPRWSMGAGGNPSVVGLDWTTYLPGNDIAVSDGTGNDPSGFGDDGIDVTFAGPVFSAGFDFVEPSLDGGVQNGCYATCVDSTFLVTLKNGASTVNAFSFNAPDDVAAFVGVWSTAAFDGLEIRETTGTDDDEFYGHFYTGTRPAPAPEPSATFLLGAGLIGLLTSLRTRGRRAARRDGGLL
jgi:hypothetical protein